MPFMSNIYLLPDLRRKGKIVVVRIRLGQHNDGFLFIEEAFVVLCRKGKIVVVRIRQG